MYLPIFLALQPRIRCIPEIGGVRIEDMVLVTAAGCEVLSAGVGKLTIAD